MAPQSAVYSLARLHRRATLVVVATAAVFISGCGLAEYEAEFEQQQKRLAYVDDENKYLAGPLEIFRKKTESNKQMPPAVDVFIRPPKGINTKPDQQFATEYFHYPANAGPAQPGQPGFKGVVEKAEKSLGFLDLYLAVNMDGNKNFLEDVLKPFGVQGTKPARLPRQTPGRESLTFDYWGFNAGTPPTTFFIYVDQGPTAVAIVYHVPGDKANDPDFRKAIDLSSQSLAIGGPAASRRKQWSFRK